MFLLLLLPLPSLPLLHRLHLPEALHPTCACHARETVAQQQPEMHRTVLHARGRGRRLADQAVVAVVVPSGWTAVQEERQEEH